MVAIGQQYIKWICQWGTGRATRAADVQKTDDPMIDCCFKCSYLTNFILPVAVVCCDLPGLLCACLRVRLTEDERQRELFEEMKKYFAYASMLSITAAAILLYWGALFLWQDEVQEAMEAMD
ncbi:unnamed protein product [Vitrella brassicaformis CCMP3155]|uniref:Uncharacterized protein n=1 Tax=Vitrella brassicaformis (strain CCMP3155) TaxID=1169540 RepID=A0A0G4FW63_VITBC|nr:unnamed protein product [Vitrella brassicaformis CCMP3155]|eukprot:CEM19444.1 unnamed protein product [Vitrella brassicaformis CCMP3155]